MQTENLNFPIKKWNQLSKEQLIYIYSLPRGEDTGGSNLRIFLNIIGLEICDPSLAVDYMVNDAHDMDSMGECLDTFENILNHKTVCLRRVGDKDNSTLFLVQSVDLAYAVYDKLKWMEEDHSLTALPFADMKIGKHRYKMPDAMLLNTSYQQYSNASNYLRTYWQLLSLLIDVDDDDTDDKKKRKKKPLTDEQKLQVMLEMVKQQKGFMASILTPYRWVVKPRFPFISKEPLWECDAEQMMIEDMNDAPSWLFDVLYHQFQDNARVFAVKFPYLFGESKGDSGKGKKEDPLIAELGTVNLILEDGGYANADAVYKENCVFIFKRLNDKQHKNEEERKAYEKAKRKG